METVNLWDVQDPAARTREAGCKRLRLQISGCLILTRKSRQNMVENVFSRMSMKFSYINHTPINRHIQYISSFFVKKDFWNRRETQEAAEDAPIPMEERGNTEN